MQLYGLSHWSNCHVFILLYFLLLFIYNFLDIDIKNVLNSFVYIIITTQTVGLHYVDRKNRENNLKKLIDFYLRNKTSVPVNTRIIYSYLFGACN